MDKKEPECLILNPVYNWLKKDIMTQNEIQLTTNFYGDIQAIRIKVPVKLYIGFTPSRPNTNIESYHLNDFIETSFQ